MTSQQAQALLRAAQAGSTLASPYVPGAGATSGALGNTASGLGIYGGIQQGGVAGDTSAAANSAKLLGNLTGNSSLNLGATGALDALGVYQGLEKGGFTGYGQAAGSGLQLAGLLSDSPGLQTAGGAILAPIDLYNEVNSWQSGKTGSDALSGAETGAAVGSIIPGVGTLIGGAVGGAAGALSSLFGSGATDPENQSFNSYTDAYNHAVAKNGVGSGQQVAAADQDPYLALAGYFDLHPNQVDPNDKTYSTYGRMGEQSFTNALTSKINNLFSSGQFEAGPNGTVIANLPNGGKANYSNTAEAANAIENQTVQPWLNSMGNFGGGANAGAMDSLIGQMTNQYLSGQAATDWKSIGGQQPFANIYGTQSPSSTQHLSRGGSVNDYERAARVHAIINGGNFAKRHYDDGGGVGYVNYFTPSTPPADYGPAPIQDISGSIGNDLNPENPFSPLGGLSTASGNIINAQNDPYGYGVNPAGGTGSQTGGGLASLLSGLGMSGSTAQSIAPYAALAPILGSMLGLGNGTTKQPTLPSQYGSALNIATPTDTRQQNNLSGMTMNDWLHAGEGPEIQYYQNNAMPATPMSSPGQQVAQAISSATGQPFAGGSQYAPLAGGTAGGVPPPQPAPTPAGGGQTVQVPNGAPQFNTQPIFHGQTLARGGPYDVPELAYGGPSPHGASVVGHVKGPGDGTSDSIKLGNAYLSNGEYVMDAPTVSMLGNGSNDAGASWLDGLRQHVRKHGGKLLAKGKQPMDTQSAGAAYAYGGAA